MLRNTFQTIKSTIRQFAKRNSEIISRFHMASKMASLVALLVIIPLGIVKPHQYETAIKLNDRSDNPLVSVDKTVNVISVPSRDEIKDATFGLDPEAIKLLMQEIGQQYNIDWRLVYAIGYHESGNYSSQLARGQFNFFGRKANSGSYASWSDLEEAIRNQFEYLQTRYFDRGLNTPAKINPVYAEDPTWHYRVEAVMNTL